MPLRLMTYLAGLAYGVLFVGLLWAGSVSVLAYVGAAAVAALAVVVGVELTLCV